jgi:hypothetical protein
MLPFFISNEKGTEKALGIVESAFQKIEEISGVEISRGYIGFGPWKEGEYKSMNWYVEKAFDEMRQQVNSKKIVEFTGKRTLSVSSKTF